MLTIEMLLDRIVHEFAGPLAGTVDTVKAGEPCQAVRGIATTFMATVPVIEKAAGLGANLILTHEPTFFNHEDDVEFLLEDDVYQAKRAVLNETGVVVARLHDYPHGLARRVPDPSLDPFMVGIVHAMGWERYSEPAHPYRCTIEPTSLADLVQEFKDKLGIASVRVAGEVEHSCSRVLLLVGAAGIRHHIGALKEFPADVIVTGECPEWECFSYAADAKALGIDRAVFAIGHQPSEEPGVRRLTGWLHDFLPDVPVTHIPAEQSVRTL